MYLQVFFSVLVILLVYAVICLLKKLRVIFSAINTSSDKHGGEIIAQVLKSHKVKFIITLCGGYISPILAAAEKEGIRIISVRHEVNAVFAADAISRVSGVIGVAAVTAGPGLTNTITAIKNAEMSQTSLLLIGGSIEGYLRGRGALQEIDQLSLIKPFCKSVFKVTRVCDLAYIIRQAICEAQSGTPGPVFVDVPVDVLYPYKYVRLGMDILANPTSWRYRLNNWYLEFYLKNLFFNASEETDYSPLPVIIPRPLSRSLSRAVRIITAAQRPLLIIGDQSILPPIPMSDLIESIKKMNIPCYLQGMATGLLGRFSPLLFRQCRKEALGEADVIILAGAICNYQLSYGKDFNKSSKIIIINRNKSKIYKNTDLYWHPTLTIEADVATSICKIAQMLQEKNTSVNLDLWMKILMTRESKQELDNKIKINNVLEKSVNPLTVLQILEDEGLDENAIVVVDGGDFDDYAERILRARNPMTWRDTGVFGTLGIGGGYALGLKLCKPESDVWIIYGDGALGYSLIEYDTFARYKLGIISVVGNNGSWDLTSRYQESMFGNRIGCKLDFTRYDTAVNGFGGKGVLVDNKNFKDLSKIFTESLEISRGGTPVLLNCMIGIVDF